MVWSGEPISTAVVGELPGRDRLGVLAFSALSHGGLPGRRVRPRPGDVALLPRRKDAVGVALWQLFIRRIAAFTEQPVEQAPGAVGEGSVREDRRQRRHASRCQSRSVGSFPAASQSATQLSARASGRVTGCSARSVSGAARSPHTHSRARIWASVSCAPVTSATWQSSR